MSKDKDEEKKFKKMAFKVLESSPEEALQTKIIKLLDKQLEILEEEVFRAGGTHPSDLTIRGLRNLVMALHKAISNVTTHLRPSSSRIKSIPPTSGNRLNLPGGPLYGGPPPPQP